MTTPNTPNQPPAPTTPAYTTLYETPSQAIGTLPPGFEESQANLLMQACQLTYQQFSDDLPFVAESQDDVDIAYMAATGNAFTQVASFSLPEVIATLGGAAPGPGDLVTSKFGFAAQSSACNVIALRGTRTYEEWIMDLDAIPTGYELVPGTGLVHGGFYKAYAGAPPGTTSTDTRPLGSLAAQVLAAVAQFKDQSLPLFVTGHSLGAALAVLCAFDMANNKGASYTGDVTMYNFAGPLVSFELTDPLPEDFVSNYDKAVPNSYRIVNACDLVPILPPGTKFSFKVGGFTFAGGYAHVAANNEIAFLSQTGSIGGNHSSLLYAGYVAGM